MSKNFDNFMNSLKETTITLDYFVDFDKVLKNREQVEIKLNTLNYLLGKVDMKTAINDIFVENPKTFDVFNILIAERKDNVKILDNEEIFLLSSYLKTPEGVFKFMLKTGLLKLFQDKEIKNLADYVLGIEVGTDTNARKNRGGTVASKTLGDILKKHSVIYDAEVSSNIYSDLHDFLNEHNLLKKTKAKQFDFVIKAKNKIYLIELNCYNVNGSKLNEVARAYTGLAEKVNQMDKYEFVWVTDGPGWHQSRNSLRDAYEAIPHVYNFKTFEENFLKIIKE
jgi:type II restriction enzyme